MVCLLQCKISVKQKNKQTNKQTNKQIWQNLSAIVFNSCRLVLYMNNPHVQVVHSAGRFRNCFKKITASLKGIDKSKRREAFVKENRLYCGINFTVGNKVWSGSWTKETVC